MDILYVDMEIDSGTELDTDMDTDTDMEMVTFKRQYTKKLKLKKLCSVHLSIENRLLSADAIVSFTISFFHKDVILGTR